MDSDGSFQVPFPIPETDEELLAQCRVETFMAGGKGGQHQNKTESGVRLVHLPSGLVTTSRKERSQHRNKSLALARLRKKLEKLNERPKPRTRTNVPKAERERRLAEKKRRGRLKKLRRPPAQEKDDGRPD
jgi:protein subunit release factor A